MHIKIPGLSRKAKIEEPTYETRTSLRRELDNERDSEDHSRDPHARCHEKLAAAERAYKEKLESTQYGLKLARRDNERMSNSYRDLSNKALQKDRELADVVKKCSEQEKTIIAQRNLNERNKQAYDTELQKQSKQFKSEFHAMKACYEKQIEEMRASHESRERQHTAEFNEFKTSCARTEEYLKQQYKDDMCELKSSSALREQSLREQYRDQVVELQSSAAAKEASLRESHDQEVRELKTSFAEKEDVMKREHHMEVQELKSSSIRRVESIKTEHEKQTKFLRQQERELGDKLLARDEKEYQAKIFAGPNVQKTDRQLQTDFIGLQKSVEDIASSSWTKDESILKTEILRKGIERYGSPLLKRAVVQDAIWSLLLEHVFASPYRVFGREGRDLEEEWIAQSGGKPTNDEIYQWPPVGMKTERWRYMTVKECMDAIRQPLSQFDPRARLRKGFAETSSTFAQELQNGLEKVVDYDSQLDGQVKRLFKKASSLWLDFAMHRCRIVVRALRPPAGSILMSQLNDENVAHLMIAPLLGRYGNAKGVDLENFVTIGDCKGDSLEIL